MQTVESYFTPNPYPGRGIFIGTSPSGKFAHIAYFIMGRSVNSRNRIFSKTADGIKTEAYNPALLSDPSLIIYHPVRVYENNLIVTNGDQTDTVLDYLKSGKTFESALKTRTYEPDPPNFTPRISALVTFSKNSFFYTLSILKAGKNAECLREFYPYSAVPGEGRAIHTYEEDGNPIPSFSGAPAQIKLPESPDDLAATLWKSLNPENRVSLYVRTVDLISGVFSERIINKHTEKQLTEDNAK